MSSLDHTKGDDWGVLPLKLMTCSTASQSQTNIKSVTLVASCATNAVIRENVFVAKHMVECGHEVKIPLAF